MANSSISFHNHLLDFHIVSIDEAEHVDTRGSVNLNASIAVDGLATKNATVHVNHLQGGTALVADDPVAVAEEGEGA